MRVLYFTLFYTPHDFRFLKALAESRHEILFLRLRSEFSHLETRNLPLEIREISFPWILKSETPADWQAVVPSFKRILDEIKPDLVHSGPVQPCGFISALSGFRPLLVMSWGSDILHDAGRDPLWTWITEFTLQNSEWLQFDCQTVRERARSFAQFPDSRTIVFPWGVDLDIFKANGDTVPIRKQQDWRDAIVVLSTRSWEPIYDIPTLLQSFHIAYLSNPALRLILMGSGSQADQVLELVHRYNLDSVVLMPGRISNTESPHWFRAANIYLSTALSDGSSISMLEALATGLPVVVTDLPSNREWVASGINGWLAKAGNAQDFAEKLLEAAAISHGDLNVMRNRNRELAEARANWPRNFGRLLAAYDEIEASYAR